MKEHILFTARDVGAAHQIKHIAKAFKKEGFRISVIGSGVGYEVFEKERLKPKLFSTGNGKFSISKNDSKYMMDRLLKTSRMIIEKVRPDAVFCGLSTFDYGIDEAVLYWASSSRFKIPSFQFLDGWGTFNHLKDGYPDMYFAIDTSTELLGYMKAKAPIRVVGSPKHFAYATISIQNLREQTRKKLKITDSDKVIGYFGQNPDAPGHDYNFLKLVQAVKKYNRKNRKDCKFLIRPHPTYIKKYKYHWQYLRKDGFEIIDVMKGFSTEEILCACDIVATCHSTIAVDYAYLSCYSTKPIGVALHLLCGEAIKKWMLRNFGYYKNPLLEKGIGFYVNEPSKLLCTFERILCDPMVRVNYFKLTKSLSMSDPCKKIVATVSSFIR